MTGKRIVVLAAFLILTISAASRAQPSPPAGAPDAAATQPSVNLLAMGDWGSNTDAQREVARVMGAYLKSSGRAFSGMLLCGDNFYVPLAGGIRDPKWRTMFEDLYDPGTFDFPFYVALGNHDYQLDRFLIEYAYAQANPQSRWKMPSRWYRVEIPKDHPLVSVIMLDSNKAMLGEKQWSDELKWLSAEMKKPRTAPWLICAAHHPLFSDGDHGDGNDLRRDWQPLFAKGGVDFYICGHDHDLQHLEVSGNPESFLLVGGGGAHTRPIKIDPHTRGPFAKSTHGFADLSFTSESARVRLISGTDGQVLHEFTRGKNGKVKIVEAGSSDGATAPSTFQHAPAFAP